MVLCSHRQTEIADVAHFPHPYLTDLTGLLQSRIIVLKSLETQKGTLSWGSKVVYSVILKRSSHKNANQPSKAPGTGETGPLGRAGSYIEPPSPRGLAPATAKRCNPIRRADWLIWVPNGERQVRSSQTVHIVINLLDSARPLCESLAACFPDESWSAAATAGRARTRRAPRDGTTYTPWRTRRDGWWWPAGGAGPPKASTAYGGWLLRANSDHCCMEPTKWLTSTEATTSGNLIRHDRKQSVRQFAAR